MQVVRRVVASVALCVLVLGCGTGTPVPPAVRPSTTRPVEPGYRRVSTLLDFETATDLVFVTAAGTSLDSARHRSGGTALLLPKGARRVDIKLSSLMSGREFPGGWTLAGLHVYSADAIDVAVSFASRARTIQIASHRWTPVLLDLTPLRQTPIPADALLTLDFSAPLVSDVWLDDVLLADNTHVFVDPSEGVDGKDAWSVRREGYDYVVERPLRFNIKLPTEESAGGWRLEEAGRIRATFRSESGTAKSLTLYQDGRSYWDGAFKPLGAVDGADEYAAQHHRPAAIRVPEDQGRVDRNSPGDANHDGYNESNGSYQVVAAARQLRITLTPRPVSLLRPVVEVRNLPPGDVRATLEGALAVDVLRLHDGRVLLMLPVRVQRSATVDVRVR